MKGMICPLADALVTKHIPAYKLCKHKRPSSLCLKKEEKKKKLASGTVCIFENKSDFQTKFCLQGYSICLDLKMHNFN